MEGYIFQENFPNRVARRHDALEPWLNTAVKTALLTKKGAFIDVGANRGQSLMKLLSVDKERPYVGFEPQLDCCFFIDKFFTQNNMANHIIIPMGLSNKRGLVELFKRHHGADDTASTIEGFRPDDFYAARQVINVITGDEILSELGVSPISIVKIDVEGAELEVLEGLKSTLAEHKPFVFFEVLNNFLVVTGRELDADTAEFRKRRASQLEALLRDLGYSIYNIRKNNIIIEIAEIELIVSGDLSITDYVAVHADYKAQFISNFPGTVS